MAKTKIIKDNEDKIYISKEDKKDRDEEFLFQLNKLLSINSSKLFWSFFDEEKITVIDMELSKYALFIIQFLYFIYESNKINIPEIPIGDINLFNEDIKFYWLLDNNHKLELEFIIEDNIKIIFIYRNNNKSITTYSHSILYEEGNIYDFFNLLLNTIIYYLDKIKIKIEENNNN